LKKLEEEIKVKSNLEAERAQREQAEQIQRDRKAQNELQVQEQLKNDLTQKRNEFLVFATTRLKITSLESILTNFKNSIASQFEQKITEWIGKKPGKLFYKASRDGFVASSFHQRCDNQGPTLTIIKANGYLFGDYTPNSWSSSNTYVNDSTKQSFIFTLTNPHSILPTKYCLARPECSIFCHPNCGPTFGSGHDIRINDQSNNNTSSYTEFPKGYSDSTGKGKGKVTFTGQRNFTVQEIEVFGFN
jgi:hypothetical protein